MRGVQFRIDSFSARIAKTRPTLTVTCLPIVEEVDSRDVDPFCRSSAT